MNRIKKREVLGKILGFASFLFLHGLSLPAFADISKNEKRNTLACPQIQVPCKRRESIKENGIRVVFCQSASSLKVGPYQEFWPNGKLKEEGCFAISKNSGQTSGQTSVPVGLWTSWYITGQCSHKAYFRNGLREGPQTDYFQNGKIYKIESYQKGRLEGKSQSFEENEDSVLEETHYHQGRIVSKIFRASHSGQVKREVFYDTKGRLLREILYEEGQKKTEYLYNLAGVWQNDYTKGKLVKKTRLIKPIRPILTKDKIKPIHSPLKSFSESKSENKK